MRKQLRLILVLIITLGAHHHISAQGVAVNATGAYPDISAIFDASSTTKGVLIPRMSLSQRNAIDSPATSLMIYDTTTNCLEMYGFGTWQTINCLCSGAPSTPSVITGNNSPCASAPNVVYSIGPVIGATTYTWTVPSGATIASGQGTTSITVDFGNSSGNVAVTASNNCGTSSASILSITINTVPGTPGAVTGATTFSNNQTGVSYSISSVNGASSYTWTAPPGASVVSGQGTTSVLVNFGVDSGSVCVTATNTCGTGNASCLSVASCYVSGSQTFNYTGSQQTFTVPCGVSSVTITMYGAQGTNGSPLPSNPNGSTGGAGGLGGQATGALAVTPGENLYVNVGGQGGYNGGGVGGTGDGNWGPGGVGGGASDLRAGGTGLGNRVIVAGGGGGGGGAESEAPYGGSAGGTGGGTNGGPGSVDADCACCVGAGGGTQNGGGIYGSDCSCGANCNAGAGSTGQGGQGLDYNSWAGGGGGGGYYGGGGGTSWDGGAGGGGGSGYTGGVTNGTMENGVQSGNGEIVITW